MNLLAPRLRKAALVLLALLGAAPGCGGENPGGAPDAAVAFTRAKLCNFLTDSAGDDLTVTVEVGQPPARLSARSGQCSADLDQPCTMIPAGEQSIRITAGGTELGSLTASFASDREYVFGTRTNQATQQLVLRRVELSDTRCQTIDPQLLILTGKL